MGTRIEERGYFKTGNKKASFLFIGLMVLCMIFATIMTLTGKAKAESTKQGQETVYGVESRVKGVSGVYILEINGHEYLRLRGDWGNGVMIHSASCTATNHH